MIWKNIKIILLRVVMWLYKNDGLSIYHYSRLYDVQVNKNIILSKWWVNKYWVSE